MLRSLCEQAAPSFYCHRTIFPNTRITCWVHPAAQSVIWPCSQVGWTQPPAPDTKFSGRHLAQLVAQINGHSHICGRSASRFWACSARLRNFPQFQPSTRVVGWDHLPHWAISITKSAGSGTFSFGDQRRRSTLLPSFDPGPSEWLRQPWTLIKDRPDLSDAATTQFWNRARTKFYPFPIHPHTAGSHLYTSTTVFFTGWSLKLC